MKELIAASNRSTTDLEVVGRVALLTLEQETSHEQAVAPVGVFSKGRFVGLSTMVDIAEVDQSSNLNFVAAPG